MSAKTLFDKIWDAHVVREEADGTTLLYIDRHLVHEVTSPQAFEGLRLAGRRPRRPKAALAVPDHNVPTTDRRLGIADPVSAKQVATLEENCRETGITLFGMNDVRQGIVHVIGPEQGFTLPGMTIVCGDSHTATHGAFGALAFGIGTSEVEHVLATQCLLQKRPKTMLIRVEGKLGPRSSAKDIILAIIGTIGTAGGTGYVIEYAGSAIRALTMEGRMTLCNMSIEGGARAGMVAPDEQTVHNLEHSGVTVSYNLTDQAQIDQLKGIVESYANTCYLVMKPYPKINPGEVAMTAWGARDVMSGVDETRVRKFIDYYRGNGGWIQGQTAPNWQAGRNAPEKPACP